MSTFAFLLALTGSIFIFADAQQLPQGPQGDWKLIDIHHGFEVFRRLKPVGYEPIGIDGNVRMYLCRYMFDEANKCWTTGRLYMNEDGELVCDLPYQSQQVMQKITHGNQEKVAVLVTTHECLSWVPIPNNADQANLPQRYIWKTGAGANCNGQPICRAWVDAKKAILPGWWDYTSKSCQIACGGAIHATGSSVELLTYNELSENIPERCDITNLN